jgi:indolepyruvate ferredoxin oxidoreductase
MDAVRDFVRINGLDRPVFGGPAAKIGIVTHGKSYLDVLQAFDELGMTQAQLEQAGVSLYKVACTWPLEPEGLRRFARGLELIVVVEEKRSLIETQIKEVLYGTAYAPAVIGKRDERGAVLFQPEMALDAVQIAIALGTRFAALPDFEAAARMTARVASLAALKTRLAPEEAMQRSFYFCSGCPHNSSTVLPEGSKGYAGIGCSWMAQTMDRATLGYTQMGGEGMAWVGEAPFSKRRHMFQNIGDGTYFHSGILAIRAAVAARTSITYKILFNDAVAMTGGQRHDGTLDPATITRQVRAEGVERIAVVSDQPDKYTSATAFAPGVTVHHRDALQTVQEELRDVQGVSVLVYDQTCAAEKRRRRKRKEYPDPAKRMVINELVCEGCGDCGVKSNCVAVVPLETEFGRKRAIDQSACNKDYSCNNGFCPSFVTVHGGSLRKGGAAGQGERALHVVLPEPALPSLDSGVYSMIVTGVGGTGVVTIGAVLGMAAHLEGKGCGILDMAGLAQKGGSVWSHLRFGATPAAVKSIRVATGGADAVIGCDIVVAASRKTLAATAKGRTRMLVNTHEAMTGEFTRDPDLQFPSRALRESLEQAVGDEQVEFVDATRQASALFGDSIAGNMFMLGHAYQRGMVPVGAAAIGKAIELNGAAVKMNLDAFLAGRRAAALVRTDQGAPGPAQPPRDWLRISTDLDDLIERRASFLTGYQDAAYAARYRTLVERVLRWERGAFPGREAIVRAVATHYFALLAYKDEYEVARLHTDAAFLDSVRNQFDGAIRLRFNLAPPLFSRRDPRTGEPMKREFGSWMLGAFGVLARLKFLRGTALDPFGYTLERREERRLIERYEVSVEQILRDTSTRNYAVAVRLASIPQKIRGFGHVKARNIVAAEIEWDDASRQLAGHEVIEIRRVA